MMEEKSADRQHYKNFFYIIIVLTTSWGLFEGWVGPNEGVTSLSLKKQFPWEDWVQNCQTEKDRGGRD